MNLYAFTVPEKPGWLKIGQTNGNVHDRIRQQLSTVHLEYNIVWTGTGLIGKREITDRDIHRLLEQRGFKREDRSEWFQCFPEDAEDALNSLKEQYRREDRRKELSDRFYEELRNWYFWANAEAGHPEYTVRIIIRLLFLFFLREKEIVPDELFRETWIDENLKENEFRYYKAVLCNLFFHALNAPAERRNEWENKNLMKQPVKVKEQLNKIPFLNGGIFLEHPGDDFALNDDYFFSETRTRMLEELGGNYPVKGIIRILSGYKYTLDESDGTELIDPEFIGRMFESLLACIDADSKENRRKITGSYYTPREIVDYMVRECLDYSITNSGAQDEEQKIQTLLSLKIFDPACGSGAFPCAVMNELMRRLDPEKTLPQTERYKRKLEILRNVIYGADIQPMAVQITVLRLFLSLVQEIRPTKSLKDNFGIEPLPNLDYK
ncbi:MAG: GIY-YIG nuclease family protein, partial [Planctomycetaceae bacterium]|nr:GIY-YIG nuclease family protein [Planctomycetaceae bacterium]